jgi:hypothetical protein
MIPPGAYDQQRNRIAAALMQNFNPAPGNAAPQGDLAPMLPPPMLQGAPGATRPPAGAPAGVAQPPAAQPLPLPGVTPPGQLPQGMAPQAQIAGSMGQRPY